MTTPTLDSLTTIRGGNPVLKSGRPQRMMLIAAFGCYSLGRPAWHISKDPRKTSGRHRRLVRRKPIAHLLPGNA